MSAGSPPAGVLAAFDCAGSPRPLPGGRGTSWRVGHVVLKPLDMTVSALQWQERLLTSLDGCVPFRVAPPLRSRGGALVESGWTAWRFEVGEHRDRHWPQIVTVGRHLHRALSAEPEPACIGSRNDVFARADRAAWGETSDHDVRPAQPWSALVSARRPVAQQSQVVHGDLTGNVMFAPGLPPLVIDLSPYWRPAGYADAVVVIDAMLWEGADVGLIDAISPCPGFDQLLLRALLFRIAVAHLAGTSSCGGQLVEAVADMVIQRTKSTPE